MKIKKKKIGEPLWKMKYEQEREMNSCCENSWKEKLVKR